PEETVIIILTATDPDPNQAAKIANLSAKQLISAVDGVEDVGLVRLSVFEEASAPSFPSSPVLPANLALGGLLGLLVGFGYVFFRQALDRGIRGQADVEPVVGARILGAVAFDPSVEHQLEVVQRDAFSSRAESLRQLRTQLRFTNTAGGSQTVVVSSSIAGEGKTSIAVNLAIMFAESGTRVLLIDADLRCPQIANILGIDGSVGLSDVLSDSVALADAVQESGHAEAFHVLPSGGPVPNPSKLLGSPTMEKLIERAETDYAVVLIDTPPLLPVADPAIIAAKTSGVVLVVSADGRTTQEDVTQAVATLNAINTSFLGVVVNKAGRTER
ncbi:polysaccharide biosynthesis tyrosine autokinase, partial [Arthrobacter sp. SAFR-044]|uniref:polysaccharide biosynthesis tyrosine autokinase n=1 Tax=Arthrobacter sp. SAFR-044 TaxID=3387278 RepID=UPI003F7CC5EA